MCGRYSFFAQTNQTEDRFDAEAVIPLIQRYNIAPGDQVYTITNDNPDEIDEYEWGFTPQWDEKQRLINARGESVAEKQTFKESFAERRCLVLADGFYEWQGNSGSKRPYRIHLANNEPFAFAGLWQQTWDKESNRQVVIVTTDPDNLMIPIHDRMPVILEPDDEDVWLHEEDPDELHSVLDPYPNQGMEAYEISKRVNDPANDSPDVLEPLGVGEQSGLGEF